MKSRLGATMTLAVSLMIAACASGGGGAEGGPESSEYSNTAQLFIVQAEGSEGAAADSMYQQALSVSLEGIAADSSNPQHYYLAGVAYSGLSDAAGADSMFTRAVALYPEYAADIEIAREQAWATLFNEAVEAYNAGNTEDAVRMWQEANAVYDKRAEAYLNLAAVYTQQGEYDRAVEAYQGARQALAQAPSRELTPEEVAAREESQETVITNLGQLLLTTERYADAEALFREYLAENPGNVSAQANLAVALAEQGNDAEAMQMYEQLLAAPDIASDDLFNVGIALFQVEDYERAAEAFRRVTEMNPQSREAWYNYAQALYAQDAWEEVIPVAERVLELDPLSENMALILARAYREAGQNQEALRVLRAKEAAPVFVTDLQFRAEEGSSRVQGTVTPNAAEAGTPVQLRFTFYGEGGEIGTQTVNVSAPAEGATANFEAVLQNPTPATGFSYEVAG